MIFYLVMSIVIAVTGFGAGLMFGYARGLEDARRY